MCAISAWRSSYCAQSIGVLSPIGRPLENVGVPDDRHTLRKLDECLALHARMIPLTPRHMWFPCRSCEPATQNQYAPTYAYADSYSPPHAAPGESFRGPRGAAPPCAALFAATSATGSRSDSFFSRLGSRCTSASMRACCSLVYVGLCPSPAVIDRA